MPDLSSLLPLAMGAAGLGYIWLQPRIEAHRARRRLVSWSRVARERGLHWHAAGRRLSGWDQSHYVSAWPVFRDQLPAGSWVSAVFWPPLDLGLQLRMPPSFVERAEVRLGADDLERARPLLTPALDHAIHAADPYDVHVTDTRALIGVARIVEPATLTELLALVRRIAAQVDAARARVPPLRLEPEARARLLHEWTELGRTLHLSATSTPFGFVGQHRKLELRFFVKRIERADYACVVMAAFRQPLQIGFSARPTARRDEAPWSTERVSSGDSEFDQRFQVYAFEPEYVRAVLHDRARARLCELCARHPNVFVDDYGVRIETELVGALAVQEMLDQVASVAEVVDFVKPERGAYR